MTDNAANAAAAAAEAAEAAAEAAGAASAEQSDAASSATDAERAALAAEAAQAAAAVTVAVAEGTAAMAEMEAAETVAEIEAEAEEWHELMSSRITAVETAQATILAQLSEMSGMLSILTTQQAPPEPAVVAEEVTIAPEAAAGGDPDGLQEAERPRRRPYRFL